MRLSVLLTKLQLSDDDDEGPPPLEYSSDEDAAPDPDPDGDTDAYSFFTEYQCFFGDRNFSSSNSSTEKPYSLWVMA